MQTQSPDKLRSYFDKVGARRKKRRFSKYYWNEITQYCKYFSHEDASVLEVGCGNGDLLSHIHGARKVGIDFSEEYIRWARHQHQGSAIEFHVMDANNITLNETFDLIILSNLIGFVGDIQH